MAASEISGFYAASDTVPNAITFYVQSPMPFGIEEGWVLTNVPGIQGQTKVIEVSLFKGSYPGYGGYNGSIDFQVNVPQTIQGTTAAPAAQLAPAPILPPPTPPTLTGVYYTQRGLLVFYSTLPISGNVTQGWNITGMPGISSTLNVQMVSFQSGNLGAFKYAGVLTAVPVTPQLVEIDPTIKDKFFSVLRKLGTFAEILGGKIADIDTEVFSDPNALSSYLSESPNLLKFFSEKTGLQPESITGDPTQLKELMGSLPQLANALGFRLRTGPNKLVDGFLNDEVMLEAIGQGRVLPPVLPSTDEYPQGFPVNGQGGLVNPKASDAFVPATVSTVKPLVRAPIEDEDFKRFPMGLRELNDAVPVPPVAPEPLTEKRNLGFNAGGILSLDAHGPQEEFISNVTNFNTSQWSPGYQQHTNSVVYQDYIQMTPASDTFIQQADPGTCIVEIQPKNQGDLIANMYVQCTLPALDGVSSYTNQIGRALIQQIDFIIDETIVETIYDDWLFIKDQIFLDYDEQIGMFNQVNGGQANQNLTPTIDVPLLIPLEFFFCRRHSGGNKGRERLRKPFFPLCALWGGQKIYIKFTFRPQYWFTNYSKPIDIINPVLLIEYVKITTNEKLHYRNTPLRYVVPVVKRDATSPYTNGVVTQNISANFPVQLIAWFIRNQQFESTDLNYYATRYIYGYATQYQAVAVPLSFPTGSVQYVDVIQSVKITINNEDLLDTFANGPYTQFLQPMQHGLSVPQKNIYMYSFGLNITEYNSGGYLNFSKINSQTSNLIISFLPEYASVLASYNLYIYYYGLSILEFNNGFAGVSYL